MRLIYLAMRSWKHQDGQMIMILILNQDKTIFMIFNLSRQKHYCDSISVGDTSITPSTETKLLGTTLDNKLSFNSHIDSLISKTNSRIFLMRQLKTAGLNADVLKTYFITNIRSILLCGSLLGIHSFPKRVKTVFNWSKEVQQEWFYQISIMKIDSFSSVCLPWTLLIAVIRFSVG